MLISMKNCIDSRNSEWIRSSTLQIFIHEKCDFREKKIWNLKYVLYFLLFFYFFIFCNMAHFRYTFGIYISLVMKSRIRPILSVGMNFWQLLPPLSRWWRFQRCTRILTGIPESDSQCEIYIYRKKSWKIMKIFLFRKKSRKNKLKPEFDERPPFWRYLWKTDIYVYISHF